MAGIIVTFHLCLYKYKEWLLYISQAKFFHLTLQEKAEIYGIAWHDQFIFLN